MILDCHSRETALTSLSGLLGLTPAELALRLREVYYDRWPDDPPTVLWQAIGGQERDFAGVYWFHLTRTLDPESFRRDGILPLNELIDSIWDMLADLAAGQISAEDKAQIRSALTGCGHSASLYALKVHDRMHWGPYAMLVRESAFRADEMMNHDYLASPEIIEDICDCIQRRFGVDLLARFREASHRCIVKFLGPPRADVLQAALMYLWAIQHNAGMGLNSNTCFDGEGNLISPDWIVDIEVDP